MRKLSFLSLLLFVLAALSAMPVSAAKADGIWTEISERSLALRPVQRTRTPDEYRTFRLDRYQLAALLVQAPAEFNRSAAEAVIELPMADGRFQKFSFEHSPIVEPGLAAKYPGLDATYVGRGIDDPTATVRFDLLSNGFHAMVLSESGTVVIDPYAVGDLDNYVVYRKDRLEKLDNFHCEVGESTIDAALHADIERARTAFGEAPEVTSAGQLRTYRLAVAATNEYSTAVGGNTTAGTLTAQVVIMNRVNGVYERDLSIRMVMIANNDLIVYSGENMSCGGAACNGGNDPYSNTSGSTMLGQNQSNLDTVIGSANYDIGHVFSTGGGGVATLNGPCGGSKARGVTGLTSPVGDVFAIDYVAHEMGHQWGANHTFNGTTSSCGGGNRSGSSAYEPGSGVTIMGYAGICGAQNLARNSIDTFHVRSLEVIVNYSQNGNGNTCAQSTPSGNTAPEVSIQGGTNFDIPKQTPFSLTAIGSDVNGDTLTYDWQQYDLGGSTTAVPNTDSDGIARPIFRPYTPTASPTRTFPSLQFILANANVPPSTSSCLGFTCLTGELLPQIGRVMNFQVIARDNRVNGGGINTATAFVTVDGNSGPFELTSQNTAESFPAGSAQTVTWSVNNTNLAPVSAANVKITFSTDGGQTFPIVLAESTANDGTETITLPNVVTSQGRIKIEGVGKIFFDISNANITLTPSSLVTLMGRVFSPTGLAQNSVRVTLIDAAGTRRIATTSSFGAYTFENVPGPASYTMTATSKRYRFSPKSVAVGTVGIANIDFTGLE